MGKFTYVEAPNKLPEQGQVVVFLAGGITNCPDWQKELVATVKAHYLESKFEGNLTLVNPRRENFPIDDPGESLKQIEWEYDMLRTCDVHSFWFSRGSLNPIVLFEYGAALEYARNIVVGVNPDYERINDVVIQTQIRRANLDIQSSIDLLGLRIFVRAVNVHDGLFGPSEAHP